MYFLKDDKSKNAETRQKSELGANPDEPRTLTLHRFYKFLGVSQLQQDKTHHAEEQSNCQSKHSFWFLPYRAAPVAVRN